MTETLSPISNFSINAKTCTLKYNAQKGGSVILDGNTRYIIPIYQRAYSWSHEEIRKLLQDIFRSFHGTDTLRSEPMFIGTMQLTERTRSNDQEIIDGQQRLTTFLILLRILKVRFPDNTELNEIKFDWLFTRVNSGQQQMFLDEFLQSDLSFNDESLNPYLKNAFLINEVIHEETHDESGDLIDFDLKGLINYLLSSIYFVVIETRAGLSKTLQIFNAINTTGLDLNGGDIFKLRMYEYLRDKKGKGETAFEEISELYRKIEHLNSVAGYNITDIHEILSIYQFFLIAKYNLPVALYTYASDTFFERLFDTLFNNAQWEHFKNNVTNLEISLEDLNRLIEVRFEWEQDWYETAEDACSYHLITWSRYSRYWILAIIYRYRFKTEVNYRNNSFLFLRQLSKLYTIYSIRFLKGINEIHSFTYSLIGEILTSTCETVLDTINKKIGKLEDHKGWGDFENALTGEIVYNSKIKNIICRLSAMLEENYLTTDKQMIEEIRGRLFDSSIDIEHIQAFHDINEEDRKLIWAEWGGEINSLGNLVVLEEHINRSIRNYAYPDKRDGYMASEYKSIHLLIATFSDWSLENCLKRKQVEVNKILNYIFN